MSEHLSAVARAMEVEDKMDMGEICTPDERAIYTLWRGYRAMAWAAEHPFQAFWIRMRNVLF